MNKMKVIESEESVNTVENTDNSKSDYNELVEHKPIGDTPFMAVRVEDKWIIRCGKYKLEKGHDSFEEVEEYVNNNLWEMIGVFVTTVVEWNNELLEINKNK